MSAFKPRRGRRGPVQGLERLVAFGYRTDEVLKAGLMKPIPPHSESLRVSVRKNAYNPSTRSPAMVSTGVHVENHALPRPDFVDPDSVILGIKKRFGHKPPEIDKKFFKEFRDFNMEHIKRNYIPIPAEEDFDFETYLENTNFPAWRKEELRLAHQKAEEMLAMPDWKEKISRVTSFIKEESYPEFKPPRPINSRLDEFKTKVGPFVKIIEKAVFSDPSYIKKVPREQWPTFIMDHVDKDYHLYVSDYSSYEALFEELMEIELDLYRWMLQYHPFCLVFVELMSGTNYFWFKHVKGSVWRKRMSGEMTTSLGNGYTTNMFHRFLIKKLFDREVIIVQEGDDTLYASPGPIDPAWYAKVGLEVKLERVTDISVAQFCQLIFDPTDLLVVRDPIQYITGFGWISAKFVGTRRFDNLMLDCRALSAMSQYPGHPIIDAFARWIHRCIAFDPIYLLEFLEETRHIDEWERQKLSRLIGMTVSDGSPPRVDPPYNTRLLIERRFGVPVELQEEIEYYFDSQTDLHPIPEEIFAGFLPLAWNAYYDWYVLNVDVRDQSWRVVDVGPQF